ncbi:MAG: PQQ-dependent sugar dehydrogenase [bacterium]
MNAAPIALLATLVALLGLTTPPPSGAQQACGLESRTPFAGHAFPLDANLVEQELEFVFPFPIEISTSIPQAVFLTHPPDGSNRLFIVNRTGLIQVMPNDPSLTLDDLETFLDLGSRIDDDNGEEGLLGMAFHPDFEENGFVYVHYTSLASECQRFSRCARIVRYRVSASDRDRADPQSAFVVLEIDRPGSGEVHNGGMIAFGGDGFLYVAVGDQNDTSTPKDLTSLRGKILRIDVDSGSELEPGIPADNPFGNEIWLYGLRNPWRFSFDRENPNDLWIGDVGQSTREEVTWLPAGSGGGHDLGWPDCEGTVSITATGCTPDTRLPDLEYPWAGGGTAVTGGYVYRGPIALLFGHYVFADLGGQIYTWDRETRDPQTGLGVFEPLQRPLRRLASFGEDEAGELYSWNLDLGSTRIGRFEVASQSPGDPFPELLSQTGLFVDTASLSPAAGLIEYEVTTPLWSDGAAKRRWMALPDGGKITFRSEDHWEFPIGTVFVKHFELEQPGSPPRRLETRIMLRQTDRWIGFTYRWNAQQTDASLLRDGLREDVPLAAGGSQTWIYPSPADCLACHSAPTGRVLGVRTRQLNRLFDYPLVTDNQLHAWNCIGLFDTDILDPDTGDPDVFARHVAIEDATASRARRARSYLDANCAICHQPGTAIADMDLRSGVLIGDMNVVGIPPVRTDLGLPDPRLIDPGVHENSALWLRMDTSEELLRMAPGTLLPDDPATSVIREWIDEVLWNASTGTPWIDSDEDGVADEVDRCPATPDPAQNDADGDGIGDACDPDLLADLRALPELPGSVGAGQTVSLSATAVNQGIGAAPASQLRFHLSRDARLGSDDPIVGDCFAAAIAGGEVSGCSDGDPIVPEALVGTGDAHWIVCADALDLVPEGDEENNCQASLVRIPEPGALACQVAALAASLLVLRARRRREDRSRPTA